MKKFSDVSELPALPEAAVGYSAGGAYGAAGHGATIRLVEAGVFDRLNIKAISGNSAGSWNGVALAHGLAQENDQLISAIQAQNAIWDAVKRDGSTQSVARHMFQGVTGHHPHSSSLHPAEELLAESAAQTLDLMASFARFSPLGMVIKSTNDNNRDRVKGIIDFDAVNASDVQFYSGALAKNRRKLTEVITRNGEHSPDTIAASSAYVSPHNINGVAHVDGGIQKAMPIQVMEENDFQHLIVFGEAPDDGILLHPIHQSEKTMQDGLPHASRELAHHLAFLSGHKPYKIHFIDFHLPSDESGRKIYTTAHIDRLIGHGYQRADTLLERFGNDITSWPGFSVDTYSVHREHDRKAALG